jgi:uncharacterized protein (DUF1800 family)
MSIPSIAANRFGFGFRAGDTPPGDAKHWLIRQLQRYDPRAPVFQTLASRAEIASEMIAFRDENKARGPKRTAALAPGETPDPVKTAQMEARKALAKAGRDHYANAVAARFQVAVASETPFVERLVHFWANHFAVSADKLGVVALSGLLEIEAIRPHVLGRFEDMLLAVEQHPAMLLYLDQVQSIGPNSPAGMRIAARGKQRGLNENLAREILELHTLGVQTGYTQADVTEFARALTGWTSAGVDKGRVAQLGDDAEPGSFTFALPRHEPGGRIILGRRYDQQGVAQATAVLRDLAHHPATARHLAIKLARHFAGDDPPAALVDRLASRYAASGGDLSAMYQTLIDAPEIWASAQVKFKTPWDWTVSAGRALGMTQVEPKWVVNTLTELGQPVWRPKSPAGYDDIAPSWTGPDALYRRVEVAERLALRFATHGDPRALATQLFPDQLSDATATAIARAESPVQGTALLLSSPEFMRR